MKHTKEVKKRISLSMKGKQNRLDTIQTEETKVKMSINNAKYWLGKKRSELTKEKIRQSLLGRKLSKEHIKKMSEANKGEKCYFYGKHYYGKDNSFFGKKHTKETRRKMSKPRQKRITEEMRKRISQNNARYWKGKHLSEKTKRKISKKLMGQNRNPKGNPKTFFKKGKEHPLWAGGITPLKKKIQNTSEYKLWRKMVFERDNYTCLICGKIGGQLNAHHIKSFANFPLLRFEVNNGMTLCFKCHMIGKKKVPLFFINK